MFGGGVGRGLVAIFKKGILPCFHKNAVMEKNYSSLHKCKNYASEKKVDKQFKDTSIGLYSLVLVEVILPNPVLKTSSDGMKVVSWSPFTISYQVR